MKREYVFWDSNTDNNVLIVLESPHSEDISDAIAWDVLSRKVFDVNDYYLEDVFEG
jgi:hypothetical protein